MDDQNSASNDRQTTQQHITLTRLGSDSRRATSCTVEAPRYKPDGRGFDSPTVSLEFCIEVILPAALWHWGTLSL